MARTGRAQLVALVPTCGAAGLPEGVRRRGVLVLHAPDERSRDRARLLGGAVACPELAPAARDSVPERRHALDAVVRRHAVSNRWRDLVVVADPATLAELAAGLCDLADPPAPDEEGVVVVALPRGTRPVRPLPVLAGAVVIALLVSLTLDRLYPLLLPGLAAGLGLVLLPWPASRHAGQTVLAAAALGALLVFVVAAGASRFPVQ